MAASKIIDGVLVTLAVVGVVGIGYMQWRIDSGKETIAYACGVLDGQRSIMKRMPHLFQASELPGSIDSCPGIADRARANGFDVEF